MKRRSLVGAVGLTTLLAASGGAWARTYPTRPVHLIIPFPPGGSTDIFARIIADPLGALLGQRVVVDNRAGAAGTIGTNAAARAAPDGYTLLMTPSTMVLSAVPAFDPRTPFHPINDFTHIINTVTSPGVIAVHPSFPARDYETFLREIRRHPGRYSYATSGIGGAGHLLFEEFQFETKTSLVHIPHRGAAPAIIDVVAGHVPILFEAVTGVLPHIEAGRLIPIVVAAPQRLTLFPHVPTFAEVGLPRLNIVTSFGISGPRGLPREVVERVHAATLRVLADPAVRRRLEDAGGVPSTPSLDNTPERFTEQIRLEFELFRSVVQRAGLQPG